MATRKKAKKSAGGSGRKSTTGRAAARKVAAPRAARKKTPAKASAKTAKAPARAPAKASSKAPAKAPTAGRRPAAKAPARKGAKPAAPAKAKASPAGRAAASAKPTNGAKGRAAATARPVRPLPPVRAAGKPLAPVRPTRPPAPRGFAARPRIPAGYTPDEHEKFMNPKMLEFFRLRLHEWRAELLKDSTETLVYLQEGPSFEPDLADRASSETDRSLHLRTRDRARKLVSKIDEALGRIDNGTYGYCEETGEPIGVRRLLARPIATLSIEAQERHERMEKTHRDE